MSCWEQWRLDVGNNSDWSLRTIVICDLLLGTMMICDWLLGTTMIRDWLLKNYH